MELDYYSPSETFVVLTADQFNGRDDGLLEQQKQDSHVCRRNGTFSLILRKIRSISICSLDCFCYSKFADLHILFLQAGFLSSLSQILYCSHRNLYFS